MLVRYLFFASLAVLVVSGQSSPRTAGEKSRADPTKESPSLGAPGAQYTGKQGSLAKPQKVKALVTAVDFQDRSITLRRAKQGQQFRVADLGEKGRQWYSVPELQLTFVVPEGLEKIDASKKAAKALGRKAVRLEDVGVGSQVQVEYYPVLRQILKMRLMRPPT